MGKINFNDNGQNTVISTCHTFEQLSGRCFTFSSAFETRRAVYIPGTSHFELATFQVLDTHMSPGATKLASMALASLCGMDIKLITLNLNSSPPPVNNSWVQTVTLSSWITLKAS